MKFGFLETLYIVLGLLLVCIPGYLLIRAKVIKENFIHSLAKFILYGCQPFLMISCFAGTAFNSSFLSEIYSTIAVGVLLYILFILFSALLFNKKSVFELQKKKKAANVLTMATAFGNVGFMGIPIVKALLPSNDTAMLLVAFTLMLFNIISFTVGVYIITGDKKYISFQKAFANPTMIGLYIGITLFFSSVSLPAFIRNPITILGDLCIGLSLLLLGMRLATIKIKELFTDGLVFISSLAKLTLVPITVFLLCQLFYVSAISTVVLTVTSAMPTASLVLMFSEVYEQDKSRASKCILVSTILSAITIPLILMIL